METPISDVTKLTLSFIPSPHIINIPFSFNFFMCSAFCFGVTSAITLSIPHSLATLLATFSLSPVSITTFIFLCFKRFITKLTFSFRVSFTPIKETKLPLTLAKIKLFPFCTKYSSSELFLIFTTFCSINFLLPINIQSPFWFSPFIPNPGITSEFFISSNCIFLSFAYLTIAFAIGCSDLPSKAAIFCNISSSDISL